MKKAPLSESILIISLPSLIHRIGGDNAKLAKHIANEYACEIKRIRRSRHWTIVGEIDSLRALSAYLKHTQPEPMRYLIQKVEDGLQPLDSPPESKREQLHNLLQQQPNMTLAELMNITQCTIAEARSARFEYTD